MQRNAKYALWAVFAATAAVRIGFGAILPVMPLYAQDHGLSTSMIAVMTNAYMLSNTLFQGYAGHLGDRIGRRPVMLAGTWLYTVSAGLFVLDGGPWFYVMLRALEGLGACAFGPAARAYVADLVPEADRGRAYGQLASFDMAGILFGPMVGGLAQNLAGVRAPFIVCAVLGLLASVPLILLTRATRSQVDAAEQVAAGANTPVQTGPGDAAEVAVLAAAAPIRVAASRIMRSPAFWAVALPTVGMAYMNAMYSVTWSLFMQHIGATNWQISLSFTVFALPMVLLMVPFGAMADRVGRHRMIAVGGLFSALATACYGFFPYPNALIGFGALDGVAAAMFSPANQAYMADVSPSGFRGKFMGLVGTVSTAATMIFVTMVGYMYEHVDPRWLFYVGALALAFSCGSAVVIMMRRPAQELREELESLAS